MSLELSSIGILQGEVPGHLDKVKVPVSAAWNFLHGMYHGRYANIHLHDSLARIDVPHLADG